MSGTALRTKGNVVVKVHKHGRTITLGKIVHVGGETVFGTPYRKRHLSTPSLPVPVLRFLQEQGTARWVIRLDDRGDCYSIPIDAIERVGEVGPDNEIYVNLQRFDRCRWVDWPYVEREVIIG